MIITKLYQDMMALSFKGENIKDIFIGMNPFVVAMVTNDQCLSVLVMRLLIKSKDNDIN